MEIGMLSMLIPEEFRNDFEKNSSHVMQDAANALQWNLYTGFCKNLGCDIPLFNIIPASSFPQYYKHPFIPNFKFATNGKNLGYCNVKFIRNFMKQIAVYKAIKEWCAQGTEEKFLFVYTIYQPVLSAIHKIKKEFPNLRVCAIVADLPDMADFSANQSLAQKIYGKIASKEAYSKLDCLDAFVLLTKYMADYMKIKQPYCVMEGISDSNTPFCATKTDEENNLKKILYTGTLHKKFGVMHLVDAFSRIKDDDFRLILCGIGDSEEEIKEAAKKDSRIEFLGQIRREEVVKLQAKATIVVNPRLNNEEFTRYSFPSKTMEYLASGVPLVAYKLDGIPDEYDSYIKYPADDTVEALRDSMYELCMLSEEERMKIGNMSKKFVYENKNPVIQTKKILDFIKNI